MINRLKISLDLRLAANKLRSISNSDLNKLIDFSSNDYLGISRDYSLSSQITSQYKEFSKCNAGFPIMGSTGSRLLSGTNGTYYEAERLISKFHDFSFSMLSNSGWDLNFGLLSTISCSETFVISDELVHNSMVMGIRAGRQKNSAQFSHNNTKSLISALTTADNSNKSEKLIAIESIYSMDGDKAPIEEILDIAMEHNAMVIIDEAHSVGVYGDRGEGIVSSLGLTKHPALLGVVYTFGKALGQHGAVFTTEYKEVIAHLVNYSKPLIYSTSLPIHSIISIIETYKYLPQLTHSRQYLFHLINHFRNECQKYNIKILESTSPIQGIIIPTNEAVLHAANSLRNLGFSCFPIRAPTVPEGSERLRIVLHTHNTVEDVSSLCEAMKSILDQNSNDSFISRIA